MHLPPSVKNWMSLAGATIAVIALFMIVFLLVITILLGKQAAYLGLVVYILLPAIMLAGLLLIPLGMLRRSRREKRGEVAAEAGWPRIDLNDKRHRNAAFIFVSGTTFLLLASAIGSYQAYHYTESLEFCGQICHTVMEPEAVAHSNSPHARVECVYCHVGPGADWYVRSKLSGMYQVYAVLAGVYPRPIPTPIENLRPARGTCEQCHWPQQFYPYRYRVHSYFLPETENPRWDIGLTMKVGGLHPATALQEGIHWHINPRVRIAYAPTDASRQEIAWVSHTNLDTGEEKIYREEGLTGLEERVMDCIDCHNRPSHQYLSPKEFVSLAMASGEIPADLPGIKSLAVELSAPAYENRQEALTALRGGIESYYRDEHPQLWQEQRSAVEQAVVGLQAAFSRNIFPYMRARWEVYPDNSGHLEFPGCFRCHNDRHRTEAGEVIGMECQLCHDINSQGPPEQLEQAPIGQSLQFRHPVDIDDAWREMFCSDCHSGLTIN
jgi:hypothetical protein